VKTYCVYIMTNEWKSTLYIGVTNNLLERVTQHKNGAGSNFTNFYKCYFLVYYEEFQSIDNAIAREKQLKNWHRDWKFNLIRTINPEMKDLSWSLI